MKIRTPVLIKLIKRTAFQIMSESKRSEPKQHKKDTHKQSEEKSVVTCSMLLELELTCRNTEFKKLRSAGAAFYDRNIKITIKMEKCTNEQLQNYTLSMNTQ